MKSLSAIVLTFASATVALAQNAIPVHLSPSAEAPVIGELESLSYAVPAEWPPSAEQKSGWQPIYYRGVFEVYVENKDVAKNLTAKPGSAYYLEPSPDAAQLSVATEQDKVDVISVDTWYCKMQLGTILLAYIQSSSTEAQVALHSLSDVPSAANRASAATASDAGTVKEFEGIVSKTGMIVRNRSGIQHKLSDPIGRVIALLDLTHIPDRIQTSDFLGQAVRVTGTLRPNENGNTVILVAQTLKLAN